MDEKKEVLTIEQRIEQITKHKEQAKEMFLKCTGAIEVLQQILKDND